MNHIPLLLWIANLAVDVGGQSAFKAAAGHNLDLDGLTHWKYMLKRPWIWIGIFCYIAEFFIWLAFLTYVPLATAMMLGSFNIVAIMMAGRFFFAEHITSWRLAGISLITLGVAIVGAGL